MVLGLIVGIVVGIAAAILSARLLAARQDAESSFADTPPGDPTSACLDAGVPPPPAIATGLGADVDAEVAKSPKFTAMITELQSDGWVIEYGDKGKGTYCNKAEKRIVVDEAEKGDTSGVLSSLAHEGGHARYQEDPYVAPDGLTRQEYLDRNANRSLKDEGEATLTSVEMRDDLAANGGPTISVPGAQAEKYESIAAKYPDPADRDTARQEIGDIFADQENPSTAPDSTYREYYEKPYADHYDKHAGGSAK